MKRGTAYWWLMTPLFLMIPLASACQPLAPVVQPTVAREKYPMGELVHFDIDATIYLCTNDMPYTIVQLTEGGSRQLSLQHACEGELGFGIDEYCQEGEITYVEVGRCSDAIFCEEILVQDTMTWDQQEYVEINAQCADRTIRRDVQQQAPQGAYQVLVKVWENDRITSRTLHEFVITSNAPAR